MDKPEDIPQSIWDEASKCVPNYVKRTIVEGIARAILSAQSQAYIDAARIALSHGEKWGADGVEGWIVARDIEEDILQRKEEMK